MSTRATVLFKENSSPMVKVYHHWDGYPEGFGREIAEFFSGIKIVNGFTPDQEEMYSFANGFGCAVAQFIEQVKDCVGNVYIDRIDSSNEWIDFSYVVDYNNETGEYDVVTNYYDKEIFKGNLEKFLDFCRNPVYNDEEEEEENIPQF